MRLMMFRQGGEKRLGVLAPDAPETVIDLSAAAVATGSATPPGDLLALIDGGAGALQAVRDLVAKATSAGRLRLSEVEVLAPLDPPRGNVLCVGRNYLKHAEEGARIRSEEVKPPTFFSKAITTINGPFSDIPIDGAISSEIDWEVELGLVIGKQGRNITRQDARQHVFGYTVINDVSARDIQNGWGGQFFKGKSMDGSCPSGPYVVTADEVPDPQALRLTLKVNGVTKQDASTADMIYPVDDVIRWLSIGMTLLPGMLVATGTPEGVGFARTPAEFLKPGDQLDSEVVGIGRMSNRMVAAREAATAS